MTICQVLGTSPLEQTQFVQLIPIGILKGVMVYVVVVAGPQRTPGNPARTLIEAYKAGRPKVKAEGWARQPTPTQIRAEMPAAVVVRNPSPGLVGDPGPSPEWPIDPAANPVRGPTCVHIQWNPGRAVLIDVNPASVAIQLAHTGRHVVRQVLSALVSCEIGIPPVIPLVPLVTRIIACDCVGALLARGDVEDLAGLHSPGKVVICRVQQTLANYGIRIAIFQNVKPVDALADGVKGSSRRVDFEAGAALDCQCRETYENPELDEIFAK